MDRRGFLKRAGGAILTVVAAPLFIPSERLDFGVPRRIILPEPAALTILGGEVMVDAFTLKRTQWEMKARAASREFDRAFFGDPLPKWLESAVAENGFPDRGMAYDSAPRVDTFLPAIRVYPPKPYRPTRLTGLDA